MSEASDRAVVAIDIGGTKTKAALCAGGRLQEYHHGPTPRDPAGAAELVASLVAEGAAEAPLAGVGIGCPGPLDPDAGVVLAPPNLPAWDDFRLAEAVAGRTGLPVRMDNDANLGALGEAVRGAGRGRRSVLYLTLSTGLGVGFVVDGRVHHGYRAMAGEVWAFRPGAFGGEGRWTLNDLCSGTGLVRRAVAAIEAGRETSLAPDGLDAIAVCRSAEAGDALAAELVAETRRAQAATVALLIHAFAPHVVVVGGGLCTEACRFLEPLVRDVPALVGIEAFRDVPIRGAALGDQAVLWGAAELARG